MTQAMVKEIHLAYLPNRIVSFRDPKKGRERDWFPFLHGKASVETPTVYVCRGFTCLPPATNEEALKKIL